MKPVDRLYEWLAQVPTPICEQILSAGLEHAESPDFERIVELLFNRKSDAGWGALVANYPRLTSPMQQRLLEEPQHLRAGLATALRGTSAKARHHALLVLSEHPCPTLSYLLPDALRDSSDAVRKTAASTLRHIAENILDCRPEKNWDEARKQEYQSNRAEVAQAVQEALRTFDLHYRLEALEVALWFVEDFEDDLWLLLGNRRSQCGHLVAEHLNSWNSPRLARFLLAALAQPAWRFPAQQVLQQWQGRAEVAALVQSTDLLTDTNIRRQLNRLKQVRWFDQLGDQLQGLPAHLRPDLPQWVCYLGLNDSTKCGLLGRWLKSSNPELRRGAIYALANLETPEALRQLAILARQDGSFSTFARWYVTGKLIKQRKQTARSAITADPITPNKAEIDGVRQFDKLWQECRQQTAQDDAKLITALQAHLPAWRPLVLERLHSSDAGERLLALRIIADSRQTADYRQELEPLLNDPTDAVRRIAYKVFATALTEHVVKDGDSWPKDDTEQPDIDTARATLQNLLLDLLNEKYDPQTTTELVRQVQELRRQLPIDARGIQISDPEEPR